ncbi:unnamed protein product [Allacma fusca]|uniref:F-box domain-containing protein n=1 Tax=Allacma fusca TaxID=39272 RepID=A0A8J2P510_9HEXA|nr:unnamed protein product [Allacma fusca]
MSCKTDELKLSKMDWPSEERLTTIGNSRSEGRFEDFRKISAKITQNLNVNFGESLISDEESASTSSNFSRDNWMRILTPVFKRMNIPTIKELRYVSRHWNNAACSELRKRTVVDLVQKTDDQIHEFAFLLQSIHQRRRPCPFQKYNLRIKMIHDQFLDVILKDPQTYVVRLDYAFERNLKLDSLFPNLSYELLQQNSSTLKFLKLSMQIHGSSRRNQQTQIFPLLLPKLTDFEFLNMSPANTNIPLSFLMFPYNILLGATNLQRFYSSSADHTLLNKIFDQNLLEKVVDLHIADFPLICSKNLSKTCLKNLRSLGIQRYMSVADQPGLGFDLLKDLFKNVSKHIEEIAISGVENISEKILPSGGCHRLRSMLLDDWFGNLNIFQSEKLPNLTNIIVSNYHGSVPIYSKVVARPHTGIEKFTFKGHVDLGNKLWQGEIKSEYTRLITYIRRQFPYITSFHLKMAELTVYIVRQVIEALPRLEELSLSSSVGVMPGFVVSIALGMNEISLRQYLHHRTEVLKSSGRQTCLLDLPELKRLTIRLFDRRDFMPINVIKHGIAKIPTLRSFAFHYNTQTNRDIRTIHAYLSHLSELTIYYSGREYWFGKNWAELKQYVNDSQLEGHIPPITLVTDQDDECVLSYRDKFNTVNYQFTSFVPKTSGLP